ncbi:hypothetical protein PIROE2DRAFT_19278 [Piromyces sp. E2]|nr:hypothetical protein PIROE2DRAFT_19278 [Piromyces sp. E2]|eukprot:OUM56213.1 hypothetical protein PIROE2DRAFT_19278 [Piromyces sp. E2]
MKNYSLIKNKVNNHNLVRRQPSPCRINGKFDRHDLQSENIRLKNKCSHHFPL